MSLFDYDYFYAIKVCFTLSKKGFDTAWLWITKISNLIGLSFYSGSMGKGLYIAHFKSSLNAVYYKSFIH